jgi:hypothetical protein
MDNQFSLRDSAGSFKIPSTKDGVIKAMCSLPSHLEIYTPYETFKVQSPNTIDPDRTNPNTLWINVKTHDVGCSSPFVARTLLMANEMLKVSSQLEDSEREKLLLKMYAIKESLLQCDKASQTYRLALEAELLAVDSSGMKLAPEARSLAYFPIIPELEAKITAFLVSARRCVTEICQIPSSFWQTSKPHSNLEHLLNKELHAKLGEAHNLNVHLKRYLSGTNRILQLRNGQEHGVTSANQKLHVKNFEMQPTNQICKPVWFLEGETAVDIAFEMKEIPLFLLDFAETIFIGCIDSTLPVWPPLGFEKIEPVDVECPIQYRLNIDASRINFPDSNT